MNLQLLTNGTPDEKKWLDIVCYDIKCNSITPNVPFTTVSNKIESVDLSSSITCNDIGIGSGGMSAVGNIDMNLNLLRNVGAIDTSDPTLNIITPTTQIINGSSEIKLDVDSVDRVVIDNTKTALYSKSVAIGPTGSFLSLNDDSSFSLGSYFANNGAIDCTAGTLALVGPAAASAVVLTNSNITTSLFNGVLRIDREIMDATSQIFKDGNSVEQLRVDNSGVSIGNAYTLPTSDGLANQYINTNGAGVCSWASPTAINPFNQNLNTSNSVQFANVNVNGLYTFPTVAGTLNYVIASNGAGGTTWQPVSALNPFNQSLNTSNNVSFNSVNTLSIDNAGVFNCGTGIGIAKLFGNIATPTNVSGSSVNINSLYDLPTIAGINGQVLTRGAGGSSTWSEPSNRGFYSIFAPVTIANTITETTIIGAGSGTLNLLANTVVAGSAFRYSTGGVFRDNANNTGFRFRLRTSVVLFDSGILLLPNIATSTAWTMNATSTYIGALIMLTTFSFNFNTGNARNGFTVQGTGAFNPAIINTFGWTLEWATANANNTLTSNFGILQKIF